MAAYLISSAVRRAGEQHRRLVEVERAVDFGHDGARARSSDRPTTMRSGRREILDRGALAQELRVGDDGDVGVGVRLPDDLLDLVAGADRHGGLGHDDGEILEQRRYRARRLVDEGQVGMTVAAPRRRADGDEDDIGVLDAARRDRS